METQVKPIYSEGKMAFSSLTEAIDTQLALLANGFVFESGNQEPRPSAYGIMWHRSWQNKAWLKSMRTAGTESAFRAYGAHRKESIYNDGTIPTVNNEPGRKKVFEQAREQRAYIAKVMNAILEYLTGLGYNPAAGRKKQYGNAREEAWTAFIHLLKEIKPDFKHSQLRVAVRKRFKGAPDQDALMKFYKNPRPKGLDISKVLSKLELL
jgi:hypothetical protein